MFVKPAANPDGSGMLQVRMEDGRLLSAAGGVVPDTQFWMRRLVHGDVVEIDANVKVGELTAEEQTTAIAGDHPAEVALTGDAP